MYYDEKWSYEYEQIEAYVLSCGAVRRAATDSSQGVETACCAMSGFAAVDTASSAVFDIANDSGSCVITLIALPQRPVGLISFPQTRIKIEGPGAEAFYHGFFLHFISGGG